MILSTSTYLEGFFGSAVTHELTFYLAAVVLVVLTAESCIKLLNRDSFGITVGVYVTVFAWYFVDPFINPEQYDYLPSSSLGQSYGQVLLFLIGFRVFTPVAIRWILRRRSSGIFDTRLTPGQILRWVAALSASYCSCHSVRPFEGDTCTAVTLYSGQLVAQSA